MWNKEGAFCSISKISLKSLHRVSDFSDGIQDCDGGTFRKHKSLVSKLFFLFSTCSPVFCCSSTRGPNASSRFWGFFTFWAILAYCAPQDFIRRTLLTLHTHVPLNFPSNWYWSIILLLFYIHIKTMGGVFVYKGGSNHKTFFYYLW